MTQTFTSSPAVSLLHADVPGSSITGQRHAHGRLVYRDVLAPTLPQVRPWSCLDVGSGNGYLLSLLACAADLVTALEPDRSNEASLHANLRNFSRLTLEYATVEDAILDRYTYVLACHSLYNVKDCRSVCSKLCDATEYGGRLVVVHHTAEGSYDAVCAAGLCAEGRRYRTDAYRMSDFSDAMGSREDGSFRRCRADLALWLGSIEQATDILAAELRCETSEARTAIAKSLERHAAFTQTPDDLFLTCFNDVLIFDRTPHDHT